MAQDMGRGIMAPENNDLIGTGASEMRTQAVTTAAAIDQVETEAGQMVADMANNLTAQIDSKVYYQGTAPLQTNFDELYTPQALYTGNTAATETHQGLAEATASAFLVLGGGTQFSAAQIQVPVSGRPLRFYVRSRVTSALWTDWVDLAEQSGAEGPAVNWLTTPASHDLRVQAFMDDYPLVSTGDKGAVVFRYDHGLTNLKSQLLPIHQAQNIPFYVAMNSRTWGDPENDGASHADARGWISNGIAEFGNHTADHQDKTTAEGIYDTIVNGRRELEAQLETNIHGFTVPGLSEHNALEGFAGGNLDNYSSTLAGGLILANHAICSGTIVPALRPLDGRVRQGGRHYTWEARTWAEVKSQIDAAVSQKKALTLMAHPRLLGTAGRFDTALAQQVISYVRQRIDDGALADISYYQSHHATIAPVTV